MKRLARCGEGRALRIGLGTGAGGCGWGLREGGAGAGSADFLLVICGTKKEQVVKIYRFGVGETAEVWVRELDPGG
jgi:hypothetical protein